MYFALIPFLHFFQILCFFTLFLYFLVLFIFVLFVFVEDGPVPKDVPSSNFDPLQNPCIGICCPGNAFQHNWTRWVWCVPCSKPGVLPLCTRIRECTHKCCSIDVYTHQLSQESSIRGQELSVMQLRLDHRPVFAQSEQPGHQVHPLVLRP